jgi:predicted 3-demethylubiquinone-9 3-methyltransferase (glyoxalase superfamily)
MTTVQPFLMFQAGDAEAAMTFYISLFDGGEITELTRHPPAGPETEGPESGGPGSGGKVARGAFRIAGQTVMCMDSPIRHAFDFTPSSSLFIECGSDAELERLAAALGEGGEVLMPLGDYGFSRRFTWVNDRFGVSWQLNLA